MVLGSNACDQLNTILYEATAKIYEIFSILCITVLDDPGHPHLVDSTIYIVPFLSISIMAAF